MNSWNMIHLDNKTINGTLYLTCKDGWSLYESRGRKYEPICVTADDFGDDYNMYEKQKDFEYDCREHLRCMIDDEAALSEIQSILEQFEEVTKQFETLGDDEAIITIGLAFYKVVKVHTMEFYEDTHNWYVGVETNESTMF